MGFLPLEETKVTDLETLILAAIDEPSSAVTASDLRQELAGRIKSMFRALPQNISQGSQILTLREMADAILSSVVPHMTTKDLGNACLASDRLSRIAGANNMSSTQVLCIIGLLLTVAADIEKTICTRKPS